MQTPSLLSTQRRMSSEEVVSLEEGRCAEERLQRSETWWVKLQTASGGGFPFTTSDQEDKVQLGGEPPRVTHAQGPVMMRCPCLCHWNEGPGGQGYLSVCSLLHSQRMTHTRHSIHIIWIN